MKGVLFILLLMLTIGEGIAQTGSEVTYANRLDENNLKQGLWIYFYDSVRTQISCKGNYLDNKKEGVWTEYYRNGKTKSMITYKNNVMDGNVKFFYETGTIAEEGLWRINRWIGEYKYYYPSGKMAYQWTFDENGRRSGLQQYFWENGNLRTSGFWDNGKESGVISEYYSNGKLHQECLWIDGKTDGVMREYYENGALKAEWVFHDGIYDPKESRLFYQKEKQNNNNVVNDKVTVKVEEPQDDPAIDRFTGSGFHKLYDKERRLVREGTFVNGILVNGKRYYYNSRNEVVKTAIYENGRIVKVIEK